MTETITVIRSPVPLTTVNNLFSITHQLIDQYRRSISIFAGTGIFLFFSISSSLINISLVMAAWLYNKFWINRKFYPSMHLMQGKTVLITDGHTGIGYETAKDLLRRGLIKFPQYLIVIFDNF
jgi:hypothetical protein